MLIGPFKPEGMLTCMLSGADPDKEIVFLSAIRLGVDLHSAPPLENPAALLTP